MQSSDGRLQKLVWGHFGGVWWFVTLSKIWQLSLRLLDLSQLCPIRRDWHPQASVWTGGGFQIRASCVGEDIGKIKSTIPPHRILLVSLLICLKTSLWLNKCLLVRVILCCTWLCTWVVSLHTISKASTAFTNGWLFEPLTFWSLTVQSLSLSGLSTLNVLRDLLRVCFCYQICWWRHWRKQALLHTGGIFCIKLF